MNTGRLGRIVVLNGAPRSGKSSIVRAMQEGLGEPWLNLGVDLSVKHVIPAKLQPGIGLRPGGERPDLEPWVSSLYAALYESAAAHSRLGLNVAMDLGHHDSYSRPLGILLDCARRLQGLPALFVGVRCPIEEILRRRSLSEEGEYVKASAGDPLPEPVRRWQDAVHDPGIYDLELDTSRLTPEECARQIASLLEHGPEKPTALERIIASAPH